MRKGASEMVKKDSWTWKLAAVLVLILSYFLVEIIVGYVTNSLALVADSFRMLSTAIALIVGLVALHFAQRPSTKYFTFGYRRTEVLGRLINGMFLMALCFSIAIEALERYMDPHMITNPKLLLTVGSLGLGVNLVSVIIMLKYRNTRSSHSHSSERAEREETEPLSDVQRDGKMQRNMKAVFLHVLGDTLGSVGVIVSAVVDWQVNADWTKYVDPTISLLIVGMLMACTVPTLRDVTRILLASAPKHMNVESLKDQILQIDGVKAVQDLHIWELQSNLVIASVHIRLASMDTFTYEHAVRQINLVFGAHNVQNTTIQPEFEDDARSRSPVTHGNDKECAPSSSQNAGQCCSHRTPSMQDGSLP